MNKVFKIAKRLLSDYVVQYELLDIDSIYLIVLTNEHDGDFDPNAYSVKGKVIWNYELTPVDNASHNKRAQRVTKNIINAQELMHKVFRNEVRGKTVHNKHGSASGDTFIYLEGWYWLFVSGFGSNHHHEKFLHLIIEEMEKISTRSEVIRSDYQRGRLTVDYN